MSEMTWSEYAAQAYSAHAASINNMQPDEAPLPWHLEVRNGFAAGCTIADASGSRVVTINSSINSAIIVRAVNEWHEMRALAKEVREAFEGWIESNPMRGSEFIPAMERLDAAVKALTREVK